MINLGNPIFLNNLLQSVPVSHTTFLEDSIIICRDVVMAQSNDILLAVALLQFWEQFVADLAEGTSHEDFLLFHDM